ncbi:putative ubiquitin-conjugating enzyme E2 7 isoform X2 [Convolutriloba macropyga]|uniref:putative ubiquitin-conjugating enzyme E2 7 isoform X2 n=1 Tax=Convolutriloba macropyga TaxID=536237 RepID=UPI003F51FBAC
MAAPGSFNTQGRLLLKKELEKLTKEPVEGFSAGLRGDNILEWNVMIMGPPDTLYEGGFFRATLSFPEEYPQRPPKMKFISKMWHPNIAKNGSVCISILHEPGDDNWGYETADERWKPVHSVTTIIMSVISMLSEGNDESPANLDAAVQWRNDYSGKYKENVMETVRLSQEHTEDG